MSCQCGSRTLLATYAPHHFALKLAGLPPPTSFGTLLASLGSQTSAAAKGDGGPLVGMVGLG